METQFQRNIDHSYLILTGIETEDPPLDYEQTMLETNRIRSLLCYYIVCHNGETQYWYEITGMISVCDYLGREGMNRQTLCRIILYLGIALQEIRNYLIREDHLILRPELMFLEDGEKDSGMHLCYSYEKQEPPEVQIRNLLLYLLEKTGPEDPEAGELCAELNRIASRGDFAFERLTEAVSPLRDQGSVRKTRFSEETESAWQEDGEEQAGFPLDEMTNDRSSEWKGEAREKDEESLYEKGKEYLKTLLKKGKTTLLKNVRNDRGRQTRPEVERSPGASCQEEGFCLSYRGERDEKDYPINRDVFHIGRRKDGNEAVLRSPHVSGFHARIEKKKGKLYLWDENSRNGTTVNGRIVNYKRPVALKRGDEILFADVRYVLV